MSDDDLEGIEEPIRAVVVAQPGQALVAQTTPAGPSDMITMATAIATALKDIVERQKLYAVISGKKYPQVEAWSTIGRMDNVVAREVGVERQEDGSYEATVELVRLSDLAVIGRASALCGMPDDRPWATRAEYARRSMAVTRATSRAFRQQYSWIMALAGYEPTPADEMPTSGGGIEVLTAKVPAPDKTDDGGLIGIAEVGTAKDSDFELRETPDGWALGFRLKANGRGGIKVIARDALAQALATMKADVVDVRVTCYGRIRDETFRPKGSKRDVVYQVLDLERIRTPDWELPAPVGERVVTFPDNVTFDAPPIAPGQETLPLTDEEKAAIAGDLG